MDIDAMGTHIHCLLAFKDKIEGMMSGADGNVSRATDQLDGLLAFKSMFEGALPLIEKTISDVAVVVDDIAAIKKDLAPVLAWIAEQQKAAEAAKAADAEAAAKIAADEPKDPPQGEQPATAEDVLGSQADHVDTVVEHPAS